MNSPISDLFHVISPVVIIIHFRVVRAAEVHPVVLVEIFPTVIVFGIHRIITSRPATVVEGLPVIPVVDGAAALLLRFRLTFRLCRRFGSFLFRFLVDLSQFFFQIALNMILSFSNGMNMLPNG